jgi:hypothetical protein
MRNVGPFSTIIGLTQYNCRLAIVKQGKTMQKERIYLQQLDGIFPFLSFLKIARVYNNLA